MRGRLPRSALTGPNLMTHRQRAASSRDRSLLQECRSERLPLLTVDEAARLFEGKWVIMRVTEVDADCLPRRGELLAHTDSQRQAWDLVTDLWGTRTADEHFYIFQAGPIIRTAVEFEAALAGIGQDETPVLERR